MGIKNILDDVHNAVSIAQAGIKGTLESLKKTPSKPKKQTVRIRIPKKKVRDESIMKPKQKRRVRNPSKLVMVSRAVIARKPNKQKPVRKSK
jgi:hypothetical protein